MSVGYGARIRRPATRSSDFILEHVNVNELSTRGIRLGYTPDVLTDAGGAN